jgi:hypothetical protein
MNLVQLANDLEYVPKDQLAQMSQDPNSSYPAYLVLSEIQRRTLNEKNYQAMQERPTTTVAEEVVDEFMQPQLAENQSQGLQVGAPQSATPLPDSNISAGLSGVPTAPMQMAASGGITGYAEGNQTALDASFQNPYADQRSLAEQGFPNEIDPDQKNMIVERYTDPDGTFAYKRALADGFNAATLAMILAPEPTSSAVGLAARGIAGTGKALYGAIRNPKQTLDKGLEALGKLKSRRQQGNRFNNPVSSPQSTSNLPTPPGYFKDIGAETVKGLVNPALRTAGAVYLGSQLLPDGEEKVVKQELTEEQLKIQELERQLAERENLKGLAGATAEKDNTGNWRDLARLGAGIMSAKNVGDIGGTVTNILDAQDKRGLVGLQSKFTQAQTDQILAKIESMDKDSILAEMKLINDAVESGVIQDIKAAQAQYNALSAQLAKLEGQKTKPAGQDANVIASYG